MLFNNRNLPESGIGQTGPDQGAPDIVYKVPLNVGHLAVRHALFGRKLWVELMRDLFIISARFILDGLRKKIV